MLSLFKVNGYKNFQETVSLDFTDVRDYKFNNSCINNGLIKKMIIYGKNAVGKTNFCSALFDIAPFYPINTPRNTVLADDETDYDVSYLNTSSNKKYAEFYYKFKFEDQNVEYIYRKAAQNTIIYEKISINDELLVEYDRKNNKLRETRGIEKLSNTLILDFENVASIFHFIIYNVPLEPDHPLKKTSTYIDRMRMLRSPVSRLGFGMRKPIQSSIFGSSGLKEFEKFLHNSGIQEGLLLLKDNDERERLYFNTTPPLPFHQVASSGTKSLLDFYVVFKRAKSNASSLLIMDEFDAFYHFELAESLIKMLDLLKNTQIIITSHNTNLLTNRIMRPDCYFIMTKEKLTSFANATTRELREGHNLEKLYTSGEFDG